MIEMTGSCQTLRPRTIAIVVAVGIVLNFAQMSAQNASVDTTPSGQVKQMYGVKCALCHGAEARGGEYGPALDGNSDLRGKSAAWLHDVIQNGIPSAGMPAFDLPVDDLNALALWIQSMNVPATPSSLPGDRAAGEQYFFGAGQLCQLPHGRGQRINFGSRSFRRRERDDSAGNPRVIA